MKKIGSTILLILFTFIQIPILAQTKIKEDSLLIRYSKTKDIREQIRINTELSELYRFNDFDKALKYAEIAYSQLGKNGIEESDRFRVHINYGIVQFYQNNYNECIVQFNTALRIADSESDNRMKIEAYASLGNVYSSINDHATALKYYSQALSMSQADSLNTAYLPILYGNIGHIYMNGKKYDAAEEYILEAIRTGEKNKVYLLDFYNNLCMIYLTRKDTINCRKYLDLGEEISENDNNHILAKAFLQINKSRYYLLKKDTLHSESALRQAEKYGIKLNSSDLLKDVSLIRYQIEKGRKNYPTALEFMERYRKYYEEISDSEKLQEALNIKYQAQLKLQEEQMKNAQIQNKLKLRINIYLTIIIVFLCLSITLYALILYRKIRKSKMTLENELEIRNKELTSKIIFLIEKNEIITNIIKDLKDAYNSTPAQARAQTLKMIRNLEQNVDNSLFNTFDTHFCQVHEKFYEHLKREIPNISPAELRVCALLRMNLSSKEIAALINISPGSVDVMRTKIRKKLGISDSKVNLTSYLMNF